MAAACAVDCTPSVRQTAARACVALFGVAAVHENARQFGVQRPHGLQWCGATSQVGLLGSPSSTALGDAHRRWCPGMAAGTC